MWYVVGAMRRWATLLFVAVSCTSETTADTQPNGPGSVVLVTIDTLRADHLPTYGYFRNTAPNLDAFAKRAIVFENAVTPMSTTLPAHTSIMTGTRPRRHGILRNGLVFEPEEGLETVPMWLSEAGYKTVAVVSASPIAEGTGISAGFSHYDDPKDGPRLGAITTDLAMTQIERLPKDDPFFMWVHYWDPHDPYEPPEPYNRKFSKKDGIKKFVEDRGTKLYHKIGRIVFDVLEINNLYDGEIAYMDEHLGRLIEALEAEGRFDDTTIVICADHGEGLWQHDWHDHGRIYNEELMVPFILKPPASSGMAHARNERMATTIDIFPTVAKLARLPLPEKAWRQFEGIDLFDDTVVRPYVLSERVNRHREGWEPGDKFALTGRDLKLFTLTEGPEQVYDLERDPYELKDIAAKQPHVLTKLKRQMNGVMTPYVTTARRTRKDVSPELIEKLRSLGYVQ